MCKRTAAHCQSKLIFIVVFLTEAIYRCKRCSGTRVYTSCALRQDKHTENLSTAFKLARLMGTHWLVNQVTTTSSEVCVATDLTHNKECWPCTLTLRPRRYYTVPSDNQVVQIMCVYVVCVCVYVCACLHVCVCVCVGVCVCVTYLSEFDPSFFLFHSTVSHKVVEHLTYGV